MPADWVPAEPTICTPAFSIARYGNGVTFTAERNQLVLSEDRPLGNPSESKIPELAMVYVRTLPHVRYSAIGINFGGCCPRQDPERFSIERFLKQGPWDEPGRPLRAMGMHFVYEMGDAVFRFGFDGGQVCREEKLEPALLLNGNFHSEVSEEDRVDGLCKLVGRWADRFSYFTALSQVILSLEDAK